MGYSGSGETRCGLAVLGEFDGPCPVLSLCGEGIMYGLSGLCVWLCVVCVCEGKTGEE